ncbi:MAG: response regulator transcription factor [Clostridiales bacterium]|nr:response regulator transcription factor [Clostridiales bacterium]
MRIVIVDDDKLVCAALTTIVQAGGIDVVGVGTSGRDAISLYEKHHPDILLMDIRMKDMTGLDAAEDILSRHPDAKILFLTTFSDDEYIIKALNIGAKGYLLKQDFESIVPALTSVSLGQSIFGDKIVSKLPGMMSHGSKSPDEYGLNEREMSILSLIAEGLSNREISSRLYLSEGTVRNYISSMLDKLSLRDRTQLAIFYYKNF